MENKFKKGDKVVPSNLFGTGFTYGLGSYEIKEAKNHKYLTVIKCGKVLNGYGSNLPAVWFDENCYYWPPEWFRKMNTQLEFNFNA